jgi:GNAT superfamily N-acetyltransferase
VGAITDAATFKESKIVHRGAMILSFSLRSGGRMCRPVWSPKLNVRKLHMLKKEIPSINENSSLNPRDWDFHLLESGDLNQACELILLSMASNCDDFGIGSENSILEGFFVKLGIMCRSRFRLRNPSMILSSDAFILVATERGSKKIAGLVEINLVDPDGGKCDVLSNPFRSLEPKPVSEPYLCNLCVAAAHKRKGLGKLLCEVAQELVVTHWKMNTMHLHFFSKNTAASALYIGMGYKLISSEVVDPDDDTNLLLFYSMDLKGSADQKATIQPREW